MKALSADARLLAQLPAAGGHVTVHSVFRLVVNLQRGREMLTLAARSVDDAPSTVVLDIEDLTTYALVPGDAGALNSEEIVLAELQVDLTEARAWTCELPAYCANPSALRTITQRLHAGDRGVLPQARPPHRRGSSPTDAVLAVRAHALLAALCAGDLEAIHTGAGALIGLGEGLTPAGDDFLVGLSVALAVPGEDDWSAPRQAVRAAVVEGSDGTNDISRAALLHAVHGRARCRVLDVLRAMGSEDTSRVWAATARLVEIGHSSGYDLLSGLVSGLRLRQCAGGSVPT